MFLFAVFPEGYDCFSFFGGTGTAISGSRCVPHAFSSISARSDGEDVHLVINRERKLPLGFSREFREKGDKENITRFSDHIADVANE